MKTRFGFIFIMLAVMCSLSAQTAIAPAFGDGTENNPYQIATLENLYWIAVSTENWNKQYLQTNDIDASETANWFNGQGWLPIGNYSTKFTGSYNGQENEISGLHINRNSTDNIGFFGYLGYKSAIRRISLLDVQISGNDYVGALAGYIGSSAVIENCQSFGEISGNDYVGGLGGKLYYFSVVEFCNSACNVSGNNNIGGLVGYNEVSTIESCTGLGEVIGNENVGGLVGQNGSNSIIQFSYSVSNITGNSRVGGLVGWNDWSSLISNSYSRSDVTRNTGTSPRIGVFVGENRLSAISYSYSIGNVYYTGVNDPTDKGFAGYDISSTFTNNFFDIQASNQNSAIGADGKTTFEMKTQSTFTGADWDFAYIWQIVSSFNDGYPSHSYNLGSIKPAGEGTENQPFQIANLEHLYWFSQRSIDWNKHYIQTADIDAAETRTWYSGQGWHPIGYHQGFRGVYDGQEHKIDGLFINRNEQNFVGFFGSVSSPGRIKNLGITNADISGKDWVGALVGTCTSSIEHCYSTGSIEGRDFVGGLVGSLEYGSDINFCYNNCFVKGNTFVGGLVGISVNSTMLQRSYSKGSVSGNNTVGGLVGSNAFESLIQNCFSWSNVFRLSGTETWIGSLVGLNDTSEIYYSYSIGSVYYDDSDDPTDKGFVGFDIDSEIYVANFFDMEASNQSTAIGATGKTTAQMKQSSTYTTAGWNFSSVWAIDSTINNGYPYLIGVTTLSPETIVPSVRYHLMNYPNPFNPTTTIQFSGNLFADKEALTIEIFNVKGQRVKQFKINNSKLIINEVVWNGTDNQQNPVSSGVYFYQIKTDSGVMGTKKMMLLK
jgi:hypothetical protein